MTDIPLLLDQDVEPGVRHRLQNYGHAVEHILTHDTLQTGAPDRKLAEYSLENNTLIVTYDDDFESNFDGDEHWGVLLISDDDWSANEVADSVHKILELYDAASLQRVNVVGREWL